MEAFFVCCLASCVCETLAVRSRLNCSPNRSLQERAAVKALAGEPSSSTEVAELLREMRQEMAATAARNDARMSAMQAEIKALKSANGRAAHVACGMMLSMTAKRCSIDETVFFTSTRETVGVLA